MNPLTPSIWRRPRDEQRPAWARPALLVLIVAAGLLYAWDATGNLEVYYAAAVRSMSMSWHDFFFASFDPAGTITIDKLPGAFWIQALSVRIFGLHPWALVAPQVLEGVASVLVLYRVVRRLAGPLAGIVAATVLVLCPATVALNRGNISDTLMVLLLLLAADATISAVIGGRVRSLVLAAIFVGLAFQAKMIEAWLVLPALGVAYLLGATGAWSRRLARLGIAGPVVAAVSLSWMVVVSLWPASHRPYVDGSSSNSIFHQVFVYNGFGRLDQASPNQLLTKAIGLPLTSPSPGWDRLLTGAFGRDTAWLIPAALIALLALLILTRSQSGRPRVAAALWGLWLLALLLTFSVSSTINAYYTAALSPAIAALLGIGVMLAWERRASLVTRLTVVATVAVTCAYAVWLLPAHGVGLATGLPEIEVVLAAAAIAALVLLRSPATDIGPAPTHGAPSPAVGPGATRASALVLAAAAILLAPAVASISVAVNALGPFDTPFESAASSRFARDLGRVANAASKLIPALERGDTGQRDLMATQTAALAAPFIYASGDEVLPIGGYSGAIPEPSLTTLKSMIAKGDFHIVVQAPTVTDPRLVWVQNNCLTLNSGTGAGSVAGGLRFAVYYCGRPAGL